jgi:hypothetical protein
MMFKRIMVSVAFAALAAILVVGLNYVVIPLDSLLWQELKNFGHVPLFVLVALALFGFFVNLPGTSGVRREYQYLLAFAALLGAGALSEYTQMIGPRDADLWDLERDISGGACALMIMASFDGRLAGRGLMKRSLFRHGLRIVAALLVLVNLVPVAIWAESYRRRAMRMPALYRLESQWDLMFTEANGAKLEIVPAPDGWAGKEDRQVGRITFGPYRFPGVIFKEPYPDWSDYGHLALDLYSEEDRVIDLVLRIDDEHCNDFVEDRFNWRMKLPPGRHSLRISLEEVRSAPEDRELDLTAIKAMILFAVVPEKGTRLYLAGMKLEP